MTRIPDKKAKKSKRRLRFAFEKENKYLGGDPFMDTVILTFTGYISIGLSSLFGIFNPSAFRENILGFVIVPILAALIVSTFLFVILKILIPTLGHSLHPE